MIRMYLHQLIQIEVFFMNKTNKKKKMGWGWGEEEGGKEEGWKEDAGKEEGWKEDGGKKEEWKADEWKEEGANISVIHKQLFILLIS